MSNFSYYMIYLYNYYRNYLNILLESLTTSECGADTNAETDECRRGEAETRGRAERRAPQREIAEQSREGEEQQRRKGQNRQISVQRTQKSASRNSLERSAAIYGAL